MRSSEKPSASKFSTHLRSGSSLASKLNLSLHETSKSSRFYWIKTVQQSITLSDQFIMLIASQLTSMSQRIKERWPVPPRKVSPQVNNLRSSWRRISMLSTNSYKGSSLRLSATWISVACTPPRLTLRSTRSFGRKYNEMSNSRFRMGHSLK